MSAQTATKIAKKIVQQVTKTQKLQKTNPSGSQPSLGKSLFEGQGEFKAVNPVQHLEEGQELLSRALKNLDTRPKVTGFENQVEQLLGEFQRSSKRSAELSGARRIATRLLEEGQNLSQRARHRRIFTPAVLPDTNTVPSTTQPTERPELPRIPTPPVVIPGIHETIDTDRDEDRVVPTIPDIPPPEEPDEEKREKDVFTCQDAERAAASFGVKAAFCTGGGSTVSIRAILKQFGVKP